MRILFLFIVILFGQQGVWAQDTTDVIALSFQGALERASQRQVQVVLANARVQESLSRIDQSNAELFPQITATANGQRQSKDLRSSGITIPTSGNYTGPFNTFDARLRISQTIFDGATLQRLKSSRAAHQLSAIELEKTKEDVLALVGAMYIHAKRAFETWQSYQMVLARDKKTYAVIKKGYGQGTRTLLELTKARAQVFRSRYQLHELKRRAREQWFDLASALGFDMSAKIIFDKDEDMKILSYRYLHQPPRSLDVLVAQEGLNVANLNTQTIRAENYPKVTLNGDYGRLGESPRNASNTYTFGVMATVPIWLGGKQKARVEEAKAKEAEAQALLEDAHFQSSAARLNAKENIANAQALIQDQVAQIAVSKQQMILVRHQYKQGLAQDLDVMNATVQYKLDEDQYKEAVAMLWMALIGHAKAQGQMQAMLL